MTEEQRNIIADSKNEDTSTNIDQDKLAQAERLAAQIEAESYSKCDIDFESKAKHNRRNDENLTDEQLVDLFSEMKRDTQAKREKEMERFKFEKAENNKNDDLLDDFNDELEAMRGQDSDNEEVSGLI